MTARSITTKLRCDAIPPGSATVHAKTGPATERVGAIRGRSRAVVSRGVRIAVVCGALAGCSLKGMAIRGIADSMSSGGTSVYLTDDDPQLVGEALPFSLKLMETVLQETPDHRGLLTATAAGFVQYTHAFVLRPAAVLEATDYEAARAQRARAKRLFLRADAYARRALDVGHPGFDLRFAREPESALRELATDDIPAVYWRAAALGSAISTDKSDMSLVADLPLVRALAERALELDEGWNRGTLHELMIMVEAGTGTGPDGLTAAEGHFERAMELNEGRLVGPLVSFAESVCVQRQDIECFQTHLERALELDVDDVPEARLANVIAQEHAEWLLSRTDELFYMAEPQEPPEGGGS